MLITVKLKEITIKIANAKERNTRKRVKECGLFLSTTEKPIRLLVQEQKAFALSSPSSSSDDDESGSRGPLKGLFLKQTLPVSSLGRNNLIC